jgi:hypothetical protein
MSIKIVFNGINSGLNNNGGSRTILLSQKVLKQLGNECVVASKMDKFTWFDHDKTINYIPSDFDVIINIAAVDYDVTKNSSIPIKVAWWRAHENWSNSEEHLKYCYLDKKVANIVNSNGLKRLLSMYGADSYLVYQGIDFDWWEDRKLRKDGVIRIGCLYHTKTRKRWKDFVKLHNILGDGGYEYISVGNAKPKETFLTKSWVNVDHNELCNAYSSCDIWFAPTESEGLHNVPIEANLCGCLVVCGDEPLNGMIYDYAFTDNTAMVYNRKDVEHAAELIKNSNWDLIENMQKHLRSSIGNREDNMAKLVSFLGRNK